MTSHLIVHGSDSALRSPIIILVRHCHLRDPQKNISLRHNRLLQFTKIREILEIIRSQQFALLARSIFSEQRFKMVVER